MLYGKPHLALLFFIVFTAVSCVTSPKTPDVSNIECNVTFLRFEKDLFAIEPSQIKDSVSSLKNKYGEFFDIFNLKIIDIGSHTNPAYPSYLTGFVTDYDINTLSEATDSVFSNFDVYRKEIESMFCYFKYYFPSEPLPTVITYISGFNQTMVSSDTLLGIGLDKYLGPASPFYGRLGLANYMKQNMYPAKIPADCARAWLMTRFDGQTAENNLLGQLIYFGKIWYVSQNLLPNAPDSIISGFNNSQLDWCRKNEKAMWVYLIENNLLFKTDYKTIGNFTAEAPYTKGFGRYSPGRAATWTGFRIVEQYMKKNREISLTQLMKENDSQKILRLAKYKP